MPILPSSNFIKIFPAKIRITAVAALVLCAVIIFPHDGMSAAERRIDAGGTRLNYIDEGSGSRTIVMIHGSHSSIYAYSLSIFDDVSKKYRAVAIDLSGFGKSKRLKKTMTLEEHVDVIHDALQKLNVKDPVLVGHSYGGAVVLRYLLKYQGEVHSAVLLSPYMAPFEHIFIGHRLAKKPVIGDMFIFGVIKPLQLFKTNRAFLTGAFYPDPVDEAYADAELPLALKRNHFRSNARDIYSLKPALKEMEARYGEIKIPVTILAGDSDAIAPTEIHGAWLHKKIPQSKFELLPKTGHQPAFTKKKEVLQAIDEAAA